MTDVAEGKSVIIVAAVSTFGRSRFGVNTMARLSGTRGGRQRTKQKQKKSNKQ